MSHILIVDDNQDACGFFDTVVRMIGHEAMVCTTAEEARLVLDEFEPDLMLLDVALPGEHGVSLCWRGRQKYPSVPILLVSAYFDMWDRDDLMDCGATEILEKPCSAEILGERIRYLLANHPIAAECGR